MNYSIDLVHLGDNCAPGIIINDILNIRKKTLFMLGMYPLNNIITYLNDNKYENIYDLQYLDIQLNNHVYHTVYNFTFNHDYLIKDSVITNYDIVKNRFDEKIENFKNTLNSKEFTVLIHFTRASKQEDIDAIILFFKKYKDRFHLIIFTNNHISVNNSLYVSIIKLDNCYYQWYKKDMKDRYELYNEIYDKCIACLKNNNIKHDLPIDFKKTYYALNY